MAGHQGIDEVTFIEPTATGRAVAVLAACSVVASATLSGVAERRPRSSWMASEQR